MDKTTKTKTKKGRLVLKLDATAIVKLENRAAAAGKSLADYVSLFLTKEVQRT